MKTGQFRSASARLRNVACMLCAAGILTGSSVSTPAQSSSAQSPPPPVQQQLDELKAGQQRLFRELDEIKALLQERSVRTNFTGPSVTSANVHGEPFLGTNTAKVAIIEYSDFDCSFCGRYARDVFPRLDEEYIGTGKVRYFFRDLPEPDETNAWFKARAARCAGDQGKFWQMHELLFSAQAAKGPEVVSLGSTLGLDLDAFNACLATKKYLENIRRSEAGARRMGLYGTPSFLVGLLTDDGDFVRVKQVLVGAQTYDKFKSLLDGLVEEAAHPGH